METFVIVIHFLVAAFLISTILLQAGKGADIGAAFGAGSSETVFGPRGAATLLHKVTIFAAVVFLITSITLTYFSRREAETVLEAVPAAAEGLDVIPAEPAEQPGKSEAAEEPAEPSN